MRVVGRLEQYIYGALVPNLTKQPDPADHVTVTCRFRPSFGFAAISFVATLEQIEQ